MKFVVDKDLVKETIQNYTTSDNKIIITFFDGSTYELPLTEDNEKRILNEMVKQTQDIVGIGYQANAMICQKEEKKRKILLFTLTCAVVTLADVTGFSTDTLENMRPALIALGSASILGVTIGSLKYKIQNDKIEEARKYAMYLSIRERLENIYDYNLFNGIKEPKLPLNINTLDNYSLYDIKRISDNLEKCEKYSFGKNNSNRTMVKKMG